MKRLFSFLLVLLALCFTLFATPAAEKSTGTELRIVSLAPNATEIIYALGLGDKVVGRTDYCNYPEEVLEKESIGTLWEPSIEKIVSLEPTVAIATSIVSPDVVAQLQKAGIAAYQILKEESLEGTYSLISEIGSILDVSSASDALVADMQKRVAAVEEKVSSVPEEKRRTACYLVSWGEYGDYAATGDTFLDGVIEAAGGINSMEEGTSWSVSRELLLEKDPDIIFLASYPYTDQEAVENSFRSTAPYSLLHGKLVFLDGDASQRQGVRTIDTIEEMARVFYPELF